MKLIYALLALTIFPVYATVIQLESGNYEVRPKDRYGNEQICTFQLQNIESEKMLILNMQDCPPVITDVRLHNFEGDEFYLSQKIDASTSARQGFKMYEIRPLSPTQFDMISHREFADGEVAKPRSIKATKR